MAHLGIGAEQFGIDAANFGIGLDTGNIGSVMAMAMAADALNSQQEAAQAVEPERQPDIVQEVATKSLGTKATRKYTKRAK